MSCWKRLACVGGALVVLEVAAPVPASAQQKGFALDRFEPSERGSEWFVLDSLDLRGTKRLSAAGVVGSWSYKPLVATDANGTERDLVRHQVFVNPGASLVMWNRARFGLTMPVAVFQNGRTVELNGVRYAPPHDAVGDLRLSGDVRLFGTYRGIATGALGTAIYFPTGSRDNYTSDGTFRLAPRATLAGEVSYFTYSARAAFAYRPLDEKFERNPLGSEIDAGLAAGARLANGNLVVGPEIFGSTIVDSQSFLKRRGTPLEILLGAHYTLKDFRFGGGIGRGLTRGWGTPAFRAFLSAEWTPRFGEDSDHDGVANEEDACPTLGGPRSSDPKTSGCPQKAEGPSVGAGTPPSPFSDRDSDGVVDREDACPDEAGNKSPDPKTNGCPPDSDGDGVYDLVDVCPTAPGPKSKDPKKNGCPADRDGDGITDERDACPEIAGLATSDPTSNGCPPDRDGDGIYDREDACVDAPGPADTDRERNGCPLARIEEGQIKLLDQVQFKSDSAEILRDSDATLVAVGMTLKMHPEIAKIRIEGHTDDRGRVEHNRELSYKRALAVSKWLMKFGIDKARLEPLGFGPRRPVDDNKTDTGRQANRRVDFFITVLTPDASRGPVTIKP
jgi:outer membrane protein OmpA-like peptidoglycan-associated protein